MDSINLTINNKQKHNWGPNCQLLLATGSMRQWVWHIIIYQAHGKTTQETKWFGHIQTTNIQKKFNIR